MKIIIPVAFVVAVLSFASSVFAENNSSTELFNGNVSNEPVFDIQKYKGKILYLDFWASWCVPCRKSFPWLNKIQAQYSPDEFIVVTINLDKNKKLATNFIKEYPANFQVFYDPKGELAKKYQIKGMPSSILFDSTGKPIAAHKGFFSKNISDYEAEIRNLIQAKNI